MHIAAPRTKQSRYPPLTLTVLQAAERDAPTGVGPIDWKRITDLSVTSRTQAIQNFDWYAMRSTIETFPKILKSGGRAEDSRLRTAQRPTYLIATLYILGWRIFCLTMINRTAPQALAALAFRPPEVELLDRLTPSPRGHTGRRHKSQRKSVPTCLLRLARPAGYLARASDPSPGNTVVWRGMARLTDIHLGFLIGIQSCG